MTEKHSHMTQISIDDVSHTGHLTERIEFSKPVKDEARLLWIKMVYDIDPINLICGRCRSCFSSCDSIHFIQARSKP